LFHEDPILKENPPIRSFWLDSPTFRPLSRVPDRGRAECDQESLSSQVLAMAATTSSEKHGGRKLPESNFH